MTTAIETPVLVTGTAGFIGYHVAARLLREGVAVAGLDSVTDYYDVSLKEARLAELKKHETFSEYRIDLADRDAVLGLFETLKPCTVIHLAAQAGVRHSIDHPFDYADANLMGFMGILEGCRRCESAHLVYASTSSVYGLDGDFPLNEHQGAAHPVSLYAATKRANELMAHSYAHLYRLPVTGLRFFTVYGPWGRPDMAYYLFTKKILAGEEIEVFNGGQMHRDFTYVDDIVEAILRIASKPATPSGDFDPKSPDPSISSAPFRVFNIGNNDPVLLNDMIVALEDLLGRKALRRDRPVQPGDVLATHADTSDLIAATGFAPATSLRDGLSRFVSWYRDFHGV
ncbi:NAD-dependent epimerase/dehydratase family protein [Tepidamorphus sp. 3E244]|uniref:NAD-dependent epimerase/dehydratase family protein n=1 Tax=Tepidamorphus sp. 3E244 TaxID=3385498 RepID=UPI0038FCBDA1